MKKQALWAAAGLAAVGGSWVVQGCGRAQAQQPPTQAAPREIQLTIYKQDFALVHEARQVDLGEGHNHLRIESVSKVLDPMTIIFDWQGAAKPPSVTSEVYDLGVASGGSLLERLEGKPVEMLWNSQDGKPGDKIEGVLEATHDGGFVIRSGDKLYVNPNGTVVASGEQSLVMMPGLSAEVESPSKQQAKLGFAYQTRGMSWSTDYVGRLSAEGDSMDLECWATLENHTGIDYPNAKITLVAGSPNRALPGTNGATFGAGGRAGLESQAKTYYSNRDFGTVPVAVGELYAYAVPATATVGQEQMNRVKMIGSTRVPVKKDYSIRVEVEGYGYYGQNPRRQNAQLSIALVNEEKSGLGMPLPAGAVRVYDDTSSSATAFIGAAYLGDTPKDQHVSLALSSVFDVYSDSHPVSSKRIDKHTVRRSFETVIHNEKKGPVDVRIVESLNQKHLVVESDRGKQIDASTRQWIIHLNAGEHRTLSWTADFAW